VERRRGGARIVELRRSLASYRSSWWLEDVTASLDDGSMLDLVFKDLGREAPGSRAWEVKPRKVTHPGREAWMYGRVLGPGDLGVPACWGAVSDPAAGRHWLFLERVSGIPLIQIGDFPVWTAVAGWLGRFHARHAWCGPLGEGPLLEHDLDFHLGWMERALERAHREAARGNGAGARAKRTLAALREVAPFHRTAAEQALAGGSTLIHGELYPANVLVERRGGLRIHVVDWEMASLGPSLLDLAALVTGRWSGRERETMTLAYRDAVRAAGGTPLEPPDFLRTLTGCRLLLAVQWLGWAPDWDPPAEHRTDWVREAVRCAEALAR
jgi:Ser/Thr protein kinase RdoA (MazF antagonist)